MNIPSNPILEGVSILPVCYVTFTCLFKGFISREDQFRQFRRDKISSICVESNFLDRTVRIKNSNNSGKYWEVVADMDVKGT